LSALPILDAVIERIGLEHPLTEEIAGSKVRNVGYRILLGQFDRGEPTMQLQTMTRVITCAAVMAVLGASGWARAQSGANTVLKPAELQKLFPATVYYDGQSAPVQLRNSAGVKFTDGHYMLASLVDTSGYSSGLAAKYQGYLIAEVPLKIGGKLLPAGAYGFGFLDGGKFLVTDLGSHDVLTAQSVTDPAMNRPRPLQVTVDAARGFRLYAGRSYVHFSR
jgi:hypothetical protein